MNPCFHPPWSCPRERGVALVVTLMMMSVLVMMVVGLAGVMRNEQASARNLTYQVVAEEMADLGARQAMAAVISSSTSSIGKPSASGPGWICVNGQNTSLYSSNSGGQVKNLDAMGTNSMILSLQTTTGLMGNVNVCWSNLVGPNGIAIGRYAWWVDDEGTKVNLNSAGFVNSNTYLPLLTNTPIPVNWLFYDPVTLAPNNASTNRAIMVRKRLGALATTESVKDESLVVPIGSDNIGDQAYRRTKGHITAWSSNVDLTPWGTTKINLADLGVTNTTSRDTALAQIKNAMNTNAWNSFFGGKTLAQKYGTLIQDQIAANLLSLVTSNQWPAPVVYATNYGNLDTNRHRQNLPLTAVSQHPGPYLNQVRLMVDQTNTPTTATVRLNCGVQIFNPNQRSLNGCTLEILPRKFRFGVNIDPASLTNNPAILPNQSGTYYRALVTPGAISPIPLTQANLFVIDDGWKQLAGNNWWPTLFWIGPEWNPTGTTTPNGDLSPFPLTNSITNSLSGSNIYSQKIVAQTIAVTFGSGMKVASLNPSSYVMVDQVILKDSAGRVLDWVSLDDFSQTGNYADGQLQLAPVAWTNAAAPAWSDLPTDGLWKTDPQARFPSSMWEGTQRGSFTSNGLVAGFSAKAWKKITDPFDCTNTNGTVTGISYLWPDPVTNGTTFNTHPHFVEGFFPSNGIQSVAQLGAIHTGLPFRTLRLQPTPAGELAKGPPDWILLDVFTATNPTTALPTINVNGMPMALGGVCKDSAGNPSPRALSVLTLMANAASPLDNKGFAVTNARGLLAPLSLTNSNSTFTQANLQTVGKNLSGVLTNQGSSAGWSSQSGWLGVRSSLTNLMPQNGLLLRGEILEIAGVADTAGQGEDVLEGRARSFLDLLTTRSDTFTVWSAGQGLAVVTNAAGNPVRTNIMGEIRKQTVFQRIPVINNGNVTGYQLKVLYTRNHVVEAN